MAKKITSGKREREKIKQSKREEKLKRKEERQNNGGSRNFEDMLAYVDENGVLHSTPQDMNPREVIDASAIEVSVPKQLEVEEDVPLQGRIDHFNTSKGYGFIKDANSGEKYFFHISSAPEGIAEGNEVTFEIERGARGMNAVRISVINK